MTIPSTVFTPDNTDLEWNPPRRGNLQHPTVCKMWRPAQPGPAAPFGYRRLPLLPPPSNGNRHSQLAPWLTPSQFSEDFPNTEGEYQGGKTPAADHCRGSSEAVKVVEVENNQPLHINNFKHAITSRYGPTPHLLCENSKKGHDETLPVQGCHIHSERPQAIRKRQTVGISVGFISGHHDIERNHDLLCARDMVSWKHGNHDAWAHDFVT